MYAESNAGQYPPSWQALAVEENLSGSEFVCPETQDEPSDRKPEHFALLDDPTAKRCSYIYLATGLQSAEVKAQTVLATEAVENHDRRGMNVLIGDGHVYWIDSKNDAELMRELLGRLATPERPIILRSPLSDSR